MAERLKWGILATGRIARSFATGLKHSDTGVLVASASRSKERAHAFASEFGGRSYGSYRELVEDPDVEAVYISSPHHLHMEHTILCARAGKHVLCEKPFTLNLAQAERALNAVREAGVFFMEAFMYRCAPQTRKIEELVRSGAIGEIRAVHAEFGFHAAEDFDNFRGDGRLGGGGLMDVGCYTVSFARMAVGQAPSAGAYHPTITDRGYDGWGSGSLRFPGGATAHFACGVHLGLNNDATIFGTDGKIHVESPWFANGKVSVFQGGYGQPRQVFDFRDTGDLYMHEADAVAKFLGAGECPYVTWQDTLEQMRALDMLRAGCGLKFEAEDWV
ncbi:MAG: Gfo/Idh/MocA family oxidoreductase [Fimbriimonadaceae bacterium]